MDHDHTYTDGDTAMDQDADEFEPTQKPELRLKNGSVHPAQPALATWLLLQGLSDVYPTDLEMLWKLTDFRSATVGTNDLEHLKDQFPTLFDQSGLLKPLTIDVLTSAVRQTPDGIAVVNPFLLDNAATLQIYTDTEKTVNQAWRQIFRDRPGQSGNSRW